MIALFGKEVDIPVDWDANADVHDGDIVRILDPVADGLESKLVSPAYAPLGQTIIDVSIFGGPIRFGVVDGASIKMHTYGPP